MAAVTEQKRKPGWMSIPGGPKEPNVQEFRTKFSALVDEKKKAFEELKAIRAEFDAARSESGDKNHAEKAERDALRKKERETRRQTDERIKGVRDERCAIENELQKLSDEVGAFDSVEEIDVAIDLVMYKLRTGAGSIEAEKETIKRLNKLEEAKGLAKAIADAEKRELGLRQESRDVQARIAELNAEFEKNLKAKMEKDSTRKEKTFDFAALHKKREAVSAKIDDLNKKIDELKANFDKAQAAWAAWRIEAQQKYADKIAAERAEREREWKAKEEARKLERRQAAHPAQRRNRDLRHPHRVAARAEGEVPPA